MTRADKILISFLIILSLVLYFGQKYIINSNQEQLAIIRVKGEIIKKIPLKNEEKLINYEIKGAVGISTIQVKNGEIRMLDSPCPDKICIKQGWIKNKNQSIVCVPNQISISIEKDTGIDEITR